MASLAGATSSTGAIVSLSRLDVAPGTTSAHEAMLDRLHDFLAEGAPERVAHLLAGIHARAGKIVAAGGGGHESDRMAAQVYAAGVVAGLAADGDLDPTDTQVVAGAVAATCGIPLAAAQLDLYLRAVASPSLVELPPRVAAEIVLRLLMHLDIAGEASLWLRTPAGEVDCIFSIRTGPGDRQARSAAQHAIVGRSRLRVVRATPYRAEPVYRFGSATAAVVVRVHGDPGRDVRAYLDAASSAMSPLLDRELLMERNLERLHAVLGAAEKRITRLAFDLHDGPVQDILALGSEVRQLGDDLDPFVLDSHRALARGRFVDLRARLVELDRNLRETAHSLESRTIVSRPLTETLHRELERFSSRSGIEGSVKVNGDPESLSAQQRISLIRAVQEALSNVREHSGATRVDVRLHARRAAVEVKVTDNGHGFEVARSLALAAERGRLGLVGMSERMRLLGGTFEIDSRVGGPTALRFSLPRWEPLDGSGE